ncbi:MAG: hypothetical protein CPDRYMAC_5587 [uncultured Paraburkholderia sp.]|nr:MAG: hypothetical protein CPDRYMAC_5587 [uncultured Paraburkholderia sp.]
MPRWTPRNARRSQQSLRDWAARQFNEQQNPPVVDGDCAVGVDIPDALFQTASRAVDSSTY